MRAAWLLVLAGCGRLGFDLEPVVGGTGSNESDAGVSDASVQTCWKFTDTSDGTDWSACTVHSIGGAIRFASDTVIDTDAQTSCVAISVGVRIGDNAQSIMVCAVFGTSILIESSVTLSARGQLPLALFAPTIDVEGTIDVASHLGGQRGAASNVDGCNPAPNSTGAGGGAGGTWTITGGVGGDQGSAAGTGGAFAHAIAAVLLRGGCDGLRGGDGTSNGGNGSGGGGGGGAVWLSADSAINDGAVTGGTITLGPTSVITASGAAGAGGAAGGKGGSGGGSGGLLVLQAKTINQDVASKIFANGGHGGGGSSATTAGTAGTDPTGPKSTGTGGDGGGDGGRGGLGYPAAGVNLAGSGGGTTSGGGGGGGGGGVIRVDTSSALSNSSFSPAPKAAVP